MKHISCCLFATIGAILSGNCYAQDAKAAKPFNLRAAEAKMGLDRLYQAWVDFSEQGPSLPSGLESSGLKLQAEILAPQRYEMILRSATPDFPEPEVIRSENGILKATLTVEMAKNRIGNSTVWLRSYNNKLVGPTLRCKPGDTLLITVANNLEPEPFDPEGMNSLESFNTTNLHTHGLHVSPSGVSDNVLLQISPGATQNYKIVLPPDHPAGTYWYHAHKHGSTAANVGSGMSGAIIIEGGEDAVAEIAKARERLFVLQQIPFYVDPDNNPEKLGVIEQKYADKCFGPGTWDTLKHHTTINGATLPTIRMKPGAVERWRFVDSAIREVIIPELVRLTPKSKAPKRLPLNEIAVDGISIGRVAPRDSVELWPGYRSDVLIKAPENAAGAVYVLRDTRTPSDPKNLSESRRYLALLVIEGGPDAMQLPKSEDLAKYRPASIDPGKVTAQQFAALGLVNSPVKKTFQFTIDRAPFDGTKARFLKLGETHEWTVTARNPNVGPVPHPFHIHVNPFEIYSITNSSGQEQLDLDATGKPIPVWKDTIIAHEGWKVMFRTEYKDFTGTYVQHCHILDHEDQGMMELVEVYADPPAAKDTAVLKKLPVTYPAPLWTLPEASGKTVSLSEMVKRPTVLVFLEGLKCPRCNVQLGELKKLADDFEKSDVQIIVVTFDSVRNLKEMTAEMDLPFPMVTDPSLKTYKAYGCHAGMPLHGVFILDSQAQVQWQVVSTVPLMDLESVRAHAASLAPKLSSIK